jgi:hypothetical protein
MSSLVLDANNHPGANGFVMGTRVDTSLFFPPWRLSLTQNSSLQQWSHRHRKLPNQYSCRLKTEDHLLPSISRPTLYPTHNVPHGLTLADLSSTIRSLAATSGHRHTTDEPSSATHSKKQSLVKWPWKRSSRNRRQPLQKAIDRGWLFGRMDPSRDIWESRQLTDNC